MQIEVYKRKRPVATGKYHEPMPQDLVATKGTELITQKEAVKNIIARYGEDLRVDIATVCEYFGVSYTTFRKHIKKDKELAEAYAEAKEIRGGRYFNRGLKVLEETYEKTASGQEMNNGQILAAKSLANYYAYAAKVFNKEYGDKTSGTVGGTTAIQINFAQTVPDFMKEAGDNGEAKH